jgi:hypothetical protein
VPRLTLLFFGAAKDVPEAAKMVTAGTAWLHFRHANQRPTAAAPSSRATTTEEVHNQRNQRYYQQKVNQPAGNVEREKPHQPHYQQNNEKHKKHGNLLCTFRFRPSLVTGIWWLQPPAVGN